jgi:quercetin dioxygenase-like cupin family protein
VIVPHAHTVGPSVSCDTTPEGRIPISVWGHRPSALQSLITAAGNLLLAHDVPTMAKYTAGKIHHTLSKPSSLYSAGGNTLPASRYLSEVLKQASPLGSPLSALAEAIEVIAPDLRWYRSKTGPFASVNFVLGHAHALVAGPGGIEERDDVHMGVTVMAPYSRFPDHRRKHPTVFLALSRVEVWSGENDWVVLPPGGTFFIDAGTEIAIRCTGNPLLLLWCHRVPFA